MVRLIDADALIELIDGGYDLDFDEVPETKRELLRMIMEQPTVDAVPVELIKERFTRLRRRRKNLDDDCVDEAWDLKMQIEALEDLLNEWAWRKEE